MEMSIGKPAYLRADRPRSLIKEEKMEKAPEFVLQDIQNILNTSERLNKRKDEIKRFLKIIEGFLTESGELDRLSSGSEITKINFREPLESYSCSILSRIDASSGWKGRMLFRLYDMGIQQNVLDISSDNVSGLSRHLMPIFYLALPEILEALVNLFPKLGENIQELIQISNMTR